MAADVRKYWRRLTLETKGASIGLAAGCAALVFAFGASMLIQGRPQPALPPPALAASTATVTVGGGAAPTQLVHGGAIFAQECVSCHGSHAQGGIGPDLRRLEITDDQMAMTIKAGVKPTMPAYGQKYSDADIQAVTQYVRSLKN